MSDITTVREAEGLILEMTRRIKAPRERVFDAWSSMEAIRYWFGPEGCSVRGGEIDFRVGGRYRFDLETEGLGPISVGGEYRAIDRPDSIAFSWQWSGHEELSKCAMEVVLAFTDAGNDETEMRLTQTGFSDRESAEHHGEGWGGSFRKLKPLLESADPAETTGA